jgi:hypothetical protein
MQHQPHAREPAHDARLERTPALESALARLRGRIVRLVWLHGLGSLALVLSLGIAFAFAADYVLRVPAALRLAHGIALSALALWALWRTLWQPLRLVPARRDLALLYERVDPSHAELLVSAVEFQAGPPGDAGDAELVARVLSEADARASTLDARAPLEPGAPRLRGLAGLLGASCVALFAISQPLLARTFAVRILGGSRPWPQRTLLSLDVPEGSLRAALERIGEELSLRVARGSDVPILVHAAGEIPGEVALHFEDGHELLLSAHHAGTFRTLLPSVQEDLSFSVSGGDDQDGLPRARVVVLRPPDVAALAVRIQPPAYAGLQPSLEPQGDVEVLAGSRLEVFVRATPAHARGRARLLPADTTIELVPRPFPELTPDETGTAPKDAAGTVAPAAHDLAELGFDFWAERSTGYRLELTDAEGLENPDPGLYRVRVIEDRAPELTVLSPATSDVELVLGGALALRARAQDDYGLSAFGWRVRGATESARTEGARSEDEGPEPRGEFVVQALPAAERVRVAWLASQRLEVDELAPAVAVDQRFEFEIEALDNRAPQPQTGRSLPIRARIVSAEEALRRMQERLAGARLAGTRLLELAREKRRRVEELVLAYESDAPAHADDLALSAVLSGQRRVVGDAHALTQDLCAVVEAVLYARLDEKAGGLLERLDTALGRWPEPGLAVEAWRDLAREVHEGRLTAGFARNLVLLSSLGLTLSEDEAPAAEAALVEAASAHDAASARAALEEALRRQAVAIERLEALLADLAEWDNYQSVLSLTRDILNRQRTLYERTRHFAEGK